MLRVCECCKYLNQETKICRLTGEEMALFTSCKNFKDKIKIIAGENNEKS